MITMKSRKVGRVLLCIVLMAGLLSAARAQEPPPIEGKPADLRWVGCGISKKSYLTALAKAYEKKTGIHINIQGGGATRGIREVAALTADIGGSCRQRIFSEEAEKGVVMVPVAWDALVVITHPENPVNDITLDDLRKVYLGEIRNWKELGGEDAPIHLFVRRGKISGVGRTLRKLLFSNFDQEFAATEIFKSSGPLEKAVEQDPLAIAVTGISSARKRKVKVLRLEGKAPTYENIQSGKYLLYRPLYLVYNKSNPKQDRIKDFIQFAMGEEGRKVIRENGTLPYLEGMNLVHNRMQESRKARLEKGLR